jgi:hypothetical protein
MISLSIRHQSHWRNLQRVIVIFTTEHGLMDIPLMASGISVSEWLFTHIGAS